jgi:hypothetical protein
VLEKLFKNLFIIGAWTCWTKQVFSKFV